MAGISYSQEMYGVMLAQAEEYRREIAEQEKRIATRERTGFFPIGNMEKAKEKVEELNRSLAVTEAHMNALDEMFRQDVARQGIDVAAFTKTEKLVFQMMEHALTIKDAMLEAAQAIAIMDKAEILGARAFRGGGPDEGWGAGGFIGPTVGPAIAAARAIAYNENQKIADDYQKKLQNAIETAHKNARSRVESILSTPTAVTPFDMFRSGEGAGMFGPYQNKWDEQARRMRDAMQNPNSPWANMIPEDVRAAGPEAMQFFGQDWLDKFYAGQKPGEIDWEAFKRQYDEAKAREDSFNAMVDKGAAIVGVSPEEIRKTLGMETGEDIANEIMRTYGEGLDKQSPGEMLLNKINTDLDENREAIVESGIAFWTTLFGSIAKTPQNAQELLISAIAPEMAQWLTDNGYIGLD